MIWKMQSNHFPAGTLGAIGHFILSSLAVLYLKDDNNNADII
ncbi:MAG: hypothetical protein ACYSWP_01455 [Planctomycetota bacterium]|jgi:hypothetical protein